MPAWEALAADGEPAAGASRCRPGARAARRPHAPSSPQLHDLLARVERRRAAHLATVIGEPGCRQVAAAAPVRAGAAGPRARGRWCATDAACHTARASSTGRSARSFAPSAGSSTAIRPRWPGRSSRPGSASCSTAPSLTAAPSASKTAVIGRLLGIEAPDDPALSEQEDAQRAREVFFAAVRACVEGLARDGPLVLVWEDIHWADEGMLDLIEHLVQWVRAPVLQICLAREELLERRAGWGGVRRDSTTMFLEPLGESETRELISSLMRVDGVNESVVAAVAARAEGNPLFAEEMVRRLSEEEGASAAELPATVQALLAARLDSLEPFQRRLLAHAAVIGRTFWEGALAPVAEAEGGDLAEALRALRDKDILVAGRGQRARRRARARVQARADPRRRVRDAAEGRAGAEALRGRALHRGPRRGARRGGRRAARRALRQSGRARQRAGPGARRHRALPRQGALLPRGRRRRGDRLLLERGRLLELRGRAASRPARMRRRSPGSSRSRAMSRCGSAASTPRSTSGSGRSIITAAARISSTSPSSTARSAPGSPTRESASRRSSTTSEAST